MASQTVDFLVQTSAALSGQFVSLVSNKDGVTKYSAVVASDLTGKWIVNPKPPAGTYTQWIGASQGALTTQVDQDFVVDPMQDDGSAIFQGAVTINGLVTVNATTITINAGAASFRPISWQTSTSQRWFLATDAVAEGGGNAGSNFVLQRFSDAGAFIDSPIYVIRSTGQVQLADGINGNLNLIAGAFTMDNGQPINMKDSGGVARQVLSTDAGNHLFLGGVAGWTGGIIIQPGTNNNILLTTLGSVQIPAGQGFDTVGAGLLQLGTANATLIAARGPQKSLIVGEALTSFAAGAQTLTAANLLGGTIEGVPTASVAYTFDTGTNIDTAITNAAVGDTFVCVIANRAGGAFNITLTAAAGITLVGNGVVAQSKNATMTFRRTGIGAWTVYVTVSA